MSQSLKKHGERALVLILCELLVLLPALGASPRAKTGARHATSAVVEPLPLQAYLLKSYLDLFKLSPELHFDQAQFQAEETRLKGNRQSCVNRFKAKIKTIDGEIDASQKKLKDKLVTSDERHNLHCTIQNLRFEKSQEQILADHGIPIAYQNMKAKLELIQDWPADYKEIQQELGDGAYRNRRWGDVKDIGFRTIAKGQSDDIKTGLNAIKQMKQEGILPPEVKNQAIVDYVNTVAQRVAAHSDLQVPLHVYVLNSKEINAFALPGGYLFVERGLLQAADDESELAGVMGHEIAHVVARHGHKLMERQTIAAIFYQAAEIAGIMLTGGIASIGTYYALQYGFQGLGMLLSLKLLGVSREYELQADQLGIQYVWNAGYDPTGFIRFFDKMATKEGYVNGISWFYDHPPFYQRMVDAEREIDFLPKRPEYVVQTSGFLKMKEELAPVVAKAKETAANRPSLIAHEKGCLAPPKMKYATGENIDDLCGTAGQAVTTKASAKTK
ncbi:MAG: M48 family metalloprotease [Acidobacteriota bacterium]|nr:M48 family metalloprotease [Acidobacteriota bacterium]